MNKENALNLLKSEGFDVELVSMVLMLNIPKDCDDVDALTGKYTAFLRQHGYDCSFGWRGKSGDSQKGV